MEEKRLVITIGRQYGSGGREIGARLAQDLGFGFYDKNILRLNSDESGIKESYFYLADERPGNKLLYKIITGLVPEDKMPSFGADLISADNLFRFQSAVIRKLAEAENCVIIGRCADYILEGTDGLVRIYLYADMDARIQRIERLGYFDSKDVKKNIKRMDRERREYHRYYTGREWESTENYDLMLNTAKLGVDGCVEAIKQYLIICGYGQYVK
ncbi:MAG TPA: cytidylate kinase-like family protein [Candidatus Cottocaccamicrobium excrementipullorum]|nr:cytidylate kinase-like family protein [Candidatus Cottocaccamicrobium excrementipullorum]